MSAAARAEARRKAILSRGTDRLNKLTTSARGEDSPGIIVHDDPPLPRTGTFLGETSDTSNMPRPRGLTPSPRASPSPSPSPAGSPFRAGPDPLEALFSSSNSGGIGSDPGAWGPDQQAQFMSALMGGAAGAGSGFPGLASPPGQGADPAVNNPFAALMAQSLVGAGPGLDTGKAPDIAPKPKSKFAKFLPILHFLTMWGLLAYFVLYLEPRSYASRRSYVVGDEESEKSSSAIRQSPTFYLDRTQPESIWYRWSQLGRGTSVIELAPFFWAFTTAQIILHSLRIFLGFDSVQPPTLLALVLPSLPPPIPSIVVNGLKYLQMAGLFLDDVAALLVGMGFLVVLGRWLTT